VFVLPQHVTAACLVQFFNEAILKRLRALYDNGADYKSMCPDYYSANQINVAVHIRRGDVTAEMFQRFTHFSSLKAVIAKIRQSAANIHFHIFSEGAESDFSELEHSDTSMHISTPVLCAFRGLVTAQQLVMAKSSFSTAAAILSRSKEIYFPDGANFKMKNWTSYDAH
jgi:hypothetical protein